MDTQRRCGLDLHAPHYQPKLIKQRPMRGGYGLAGFGVALEPSIRPSPTIAGDPSDPLGQAGEMRGTSSLTLDPLPGDPLAGRGKDGREMGYKLVRVDQETYAGNEVEKVIEPDVGGPPLFIIYLKSGLRIISTHPVTVIEEVGK